MASTARRKNPVGLAIGVGIVGLLAAGGAYWYVSRKAATGSVPTAPGSLSEREFDKARAKELAAEAYAARGGDKVGISVSTLMANTTPRASGPRFQTSDEA